MLAVVLAGALVTYGGVSLFVAFFVLAPMAQALFRAAGIPRRLMPAAIALGTSTFTMSALPGTPSIQNAIPMPFFGTTPFAAPGSRHHRLRHHAGLRPVVARPRRSRGPRARARAMGGSGDSRTEQRPTIRSCASARRPSQARSIRPRSATAITAKHCRRSCLAALPLVVVIAVNLLMSLVVLPRLDTLPFSRRSAGARRRSRRSAACGRWSWRSRPPSSILVLINRQRLPALRESMDAGANASVLPAFSVASLVGFGAVVAALPAFAVVRDWVLSIGGGPLVSLARRDQSCWPR